jgi:hypothetical protein
VYGEASPDATALPPGFSAGHSKRAGTLRNRFTSVPGENLRIPPLKPIAAKCKHPQVRVVARDEDAEFVECQQCGEVFDSIEYRDMILEEEELRSGSSEDPA